MTDQVLPSRMTLITFKERLSAARTGHSLLKKKSDAIKLHLSKLLKKIRDLKRNVGKNASNAYFSQVQAQYAAGKINNRVIENVTDEASYQVYSRYDNVAGVKIPVFKRVDNLIISNKAQPIVGLLKVVYKYQNVEILLYHY